MSPQATYVLMSDADLCTLMAYCPAASCASVTVVSVVVDVPLALDGATLVSGYAGAGSSFAHVPLWMCAGCGPAGDGVSVRVTTRPPPVCASVAVPVSPELFCALSVIVTGPAVIAAGGGEAIVCAPAVVPRDAARTAATMRRSVMNLLLGAAEPRTGAPPSGDDDGSPHTQESSVRTHAGRS